MKYEKSILLILFLAIMQLSTAQTSKLLGSWQSSDGSEVIFTPNEVTISGVKYKYRIEGGDMYVDDEFGNPYKYTYNITGNKLSLNIPGVGTYVFTKKQTQQQGSNPFGSITAGNKQSSPQSELIGNWQATNGAITSFDQQYMTIAGSPYRYSVQGNIITVYDQANNTMTYKYQVKANQLYLYVEGTGTYTLTKVANGQQTVNVNRGYSANQAQGSGNSAANAKLYGTFCSYSSSGYSGSSSYSTTEHVSFDGRGHYRYGSESSYSGNGDGYAGGDGGYSGTYNVQGNTILLTASDGSQYKVTVFFVQDSGEITEVKYDDTVYAKSLCD
jgi:hypothetical protein